MTFPIQRQSDTYGVFDDGLHFAKDYTTRDLPEGLVNMLQGPRITAGMNNTRTAGPDNINFEGGGIGFGEPGGPQMMPNGETNPMTGKAYTVKNPLPPLTAGMHDTRFDPRVDADQGYYDYGSDRPSMSDLYADEPHHMSGDEFDAEYPNGEPHHYTEDAFREQPATPLQPLDDMLEHGRRPDPPPPSHDYLAQFRPHLASFTEARHLTADDGPAPDLFTPMLHQPGERLNPASVELGQDWVTAAVMQPQVVPGWVGHGYAPGHRVGLPWRQQVIPGTVTHLDGQQVGIRWDDGQHSTEEPSDLRPL